LTASQFVDKLNANAFDPGVPESTGSLTVAERDALVAQLTPNPSSPTLRAQALNLGQRPLRHAADQEGLRL
jgi:hypothetical protein